MARVRRNGPRPQTLPIRRLREQIKAAQEIGLTTMPEGVERPTTRRDCLPGGCNEHRPCPWVGCKHHLYLDVADNGSIKLNFPLVEPDQLHLMEETCVLDVAERDGLVGSGEGPGVTLDVTGKLMNVTRERARQMEVKALAQGKRTAGLRQLVDEDEVQAIDRRNADHLSELRISGEQHRRELAEAAKSDTEQMRLERNHIPNAAPVLEDEADSDEVDESDNEVVDSDSEPTYG